MLGKHCRRASCVEERVPLRITSFLTLRQRVEFGWDTRLFEVAFSSFSSRNPNPLLLSYRQKSLLSIPRYDECAMLARKNLLLIYFTIGLLATGLAAWRFYS